MSKKLRAMIITFSIIGFVTLSIILFMAFSPQFGGEATDTHKQIIVQSPQFRAGKFANSNNEQVNMSGRNMMAMIKEQFKDHPNTSPQDGPVVLNMDSTELANYKGDLRLFWFGHSTFLIQANGKNIILDPMFGESASPIPHIAVQRFNKKLPIALEQLPQIDAVLISHDHYDHLDYASIQGLKDKTKAYYAPLGVGAHLEAWGIDKTQIHELDWWQNAEYDDLRFVCTPAQHFSGRGKWFSDQASTLWSSWVIQTNDNNIFFSGDSGYGSHFKAIGNTYGPFDVALMECGQYNELWKEIHMMPEETVQAAIDVKAKLLMPIHWGAFKLAMHHWTDPIEQALAFSQKENIALLAPRIGEEIVVNKPQPETVAWWHK